ncbi:MAG: beta-ketoacyl-ACP synthase 3 [Thermoleophilaceae bacterium]
MQSLTDTAALRSAAVPAGLRHAGIAGLGAALPEERVMSDTIAERLGVAAGWIEKRTGIVSRRRAAAGDRLADLAAAAGRAALDDAGMGADAIDVVMVATLSADEVTPNAAPQVAHALGSNAAAMDIGAACTGFVSGLAVGAGLIESLRADTVLVIGAEMLSRHVDLDDRSTAGLFGDGAGAAVLSPRASGGIGPAVLGSDGAAAPFICAPRETGLIQMDGHETFKRAVMTLATNAVEAIEASGLTLDDIDLFVLHQANGRILSAVADTLRVDPARVLNVIAEAGNTSAASIPLALAQARADGRIADGDRLLLGAVGAGFTWGATVVDWGPA